MLALVVKRGESPRDDLIYVTREFVSHEFAERAKYNRDWFCLCTTDYVGDIESLFMLTRNPPLKPSPAPLTVCVGNHAQKSSGVENGALH